MHLPRNYTVTDFENHNKHQDKTSLCAFLDLGLAGHTLQSLFSPFRNRKFPPMSHTTGFHVKIKPEDHWSCIAHLSAEDMLKSVVIEEKKFNIVLG